jgi:hypothetical protein
MASSHPVLEVDRIALRPLAAKDVEELASIGDYEGFCLLQGTASGYGADQEELRRESIRHWANHRA